MKTPEEYHQMAIEAHLRAHQSAVCERFGHTYSDDECTTCGDVREQQSPTEGMGGLVAAILISVGMILGAGIVALVVHLTEAR